MTSTRLPRTPLVAYLFLVRPMKSSAVESRIDGFLCKYTPEIKARLQESRSRLRGFFPRGFELVFDNYNALVFAISPSERRSDAFVSVVGLSQLGDTFLP